jgi:hypothetical protein
MRTTRTTIDGACHSGDVWVAGHWALPFGSLLDPFITETKGRTMPSLDCLPPARAVERTNAQRTRQARGSSAGSELVARGDSLTSRLGPWAARRAAIVTGGTMTYPVAHPLFERRYRTGPSATSALAADDAGGWPRKFGTCRQKRGPLPKIARVHNQ